MSRNFLVPDSEDIIAFPVMSLAKYHTKKANESTQMGRPDARYASGMARFFTLRSAATD